MYPHWWCCCWYNFIRVFIQLEPFQLCFVLKEFTTPILMQVRSTTDIYIAITTKYIFRSSMFSNHYRIIRSISAAIATIGPIRSRKVSLDSTCLCHDFVSVALGRTCRSVGEEWLFNSTGTLNTHIAYLLTSLTSYWLAKIDDVLVADLSPSEVLVDAYDLDGRRTSPSCSLSILTNVPRSFGQQRQTWHVSYRTCRFWVRSYYVHPRA